MTLNAFFDDRKRGLIDELSRVADSAGVRAAVIAGVSYDAELLVSRLEALKFVREIGRCPSFHELQIDRYLHVASGDRVQLFVQGEPCCPGFSDRFPSPSEIDLLSDKSLPLVGILDTLALKVKLGRGDDLGDFVRLAQEDSIDWNEVRSRIGDDRLKMRLDDWRRQAADDIEREKLHVVPNLE